MAADEFSIDVREYEGLVDDGVDLEAIASEEAFKASVRTQTAWRSNLNRGEGSSGSHPRPYRNTGEAVSDVTISPPKKGAMEYLVGGDVVQLAVAEYGRVPTPGRPPPFEAIADWARERGLTPESGQTFSEMVDGIRWGIAQNGLEGFAPGRKAALEIGPTYPENVRDRINRLIDDQEE